MFGVIDRLRFFDDQCGAEDKYRDPGLVSSVKEYVGQAAWEQAAQVGSVGRLCLFAFYKASLQKDSKGIKSGIRYPRIGP